MCGWVGIFGAVEHEQILRRARQTLSSRGPDGSGERTQSGYSFRGVSTRVSCWH